MLDDAEVREHVHRAESLLEKVEKLPDEQARLIAVNALQALITLYGEALARVVAHARREEDQNGQSPLLQALATDELVSHLLLLHDLHPVSLQRRVHQALEEIETYLQSRGVTAELLHIREGVATVRLSSAGRRELRDAVRTAILQAAPELQRVALETPDGAAQRQTQKPGTSAFVPLNTLAAQQESESNG